MKLLRIALVLFSVICSTTAYAYWGINSDLADEKADKADSEITGMAQRGIDCVFLNMYGTSKNRQDCIDTQNKLSSAGISSFWNLPLTISDIERIIGIDTTFEGDVDKNDTVILQDGSQTYFGTKDRIGNIFKPDMLGQSQRFAKSMARSLKNAGGFMVTSDANLRNGSYDKDALTSWQRFLKNFFKDDSPDTDTNVDTTTFNSGYSSHYKLWSQVPMFSTSDLADPRNQQLVDAWLATSYADFVDKICESMKSINKDLLLGPGVDGMSLDSSDVSIIASMKNINTIFINDPDSAAACESVAAAFDKKLFANDVKLDSKDIDAAHTQALKLLPYVAGTCFEKSDMSQRVISEIAPFVGSLHSIDNRASVLWIISNSRDEVDVSDIFNASCVSEATLAVNPSAVDYSRYKAVIYRSSSACMSLEILQKLFNYALKGGVVFLDAYRIGSQSALTGRVNQPFWWTSMRLARDAFSEGKTTALYDGKVYGFSTVAPYLLPEKDKIEAAGNVEDSTGANYPLILSRKIGNSGGKWVFINVPGAIQAKFKMLKDIVHDYTSVDLPDSSLPRVFTSANCVLVLGGSTPQTANMPCSYPNVVTFDPFSHEAFVVNSENGQITLPGKVQENGAQIWVVKPYGQPVVLYTDGTPNYHASTSDGTFSAGKLIFKFAERAYISSPKVPVSAEVDGKPIDFKYDPDQHLVTIERTGNTADAELDY